MLTTFISIQVFIATFMATQLFLNWNAIKFILNNISDIRIEYIPTYPVKNSDIRFHVDICNKYYSYMYSSNSSCYFTIPTDATRDNFVRVMIIETNGELDTDSVKKLSYRLLKIKKFLLVFIHENRVIIANFYNPYRAKMYTYGDYKNYNDTIYTQSIFKDILDYLGYKFDDEKPKEEKSAFLKLVDLVENKKILEEAKYYNISITPPSSYSGSLYEWRRSCSEEIVRRINAKEFIVDRSTCYSPTDVKNYNYFIHYGHVYNGGDYIYDIFVRKSDGRVFISNLHTDNNIFYCIKMNDSVCNNIKISNHNDFLIPTTNSGYCPIQSGGNGGAGADEEIVAYYYNSHLYDDTRAGSMQAVTIGDKMIFAKKPNNTSSFTDKYSLADLLTLDIKQLDNNSFYFTTDTKEMYKIIDDNLVKICTDSKILEDIVKSLEDPKVLKNFIENLNDLN